MDHDTIKITGELRNSFEFEFFVMGFNKIYIVIIGAIIVTYTVYDYVYTFVSSVRILQHISA